MHGLFSALLRWTTLGATPVGQPLVAALNYLRGMKDWTKVRMSDASTEFLPPASLRQPYSWSAQLMLG